MKIKKESGGSLVEVMVALFVLAIGLLGMLAMQTKSMQFNQSAHNYTKTVYLASDIVEKMRNNKSAIASYIAAPGATAPANACETACSAQQLAALDVYDWHQRVATTLPSGEASVAISPDDATYHEIIIKFDDSRSSQVATDALDIAAVAEEERLQIYKLQVRI